MAWVVLISQRNAAWDTEELHDALTYNILWIQICPLTTSFPPPGQAGDFSSLRNLFEQADD